MPAPEPIAASIVRRLREAGHVAYYAGGCVRDMLRGVPAKDYDIATSARNLHITYETARTHLRRIFAKTGIRRQSDLVRQLMRTVGAII